MSTNTHRPLAERIWHHWVRWFWGALALLVVVFALGWWLARPPEPGPFYDAELAAGATPGQLLGIEPFEHGIPESARAWRILYVSSDPDGRPRPASGLVVARRDVEAGPVVAWAHGTTGIDNGCAPSLKDEPFAYVPAFEQAVDAGWIWVAPDYPGLGTPGAHRYLDGPAEARAVLDAVRAARAIEGLAPQPETVVWGHSQGGHAALWTGIEAASYAPDVALSGVAAVAPATDLPALVEAVHDAFMGRLLSALLVEAYARIYPDVDFDEQVRPFARPLAHDVAGRCTAGAEILVSMLPSLIASPSIFAAPPPSGAFARRLADNVPDGPIDAPVLILQGGADRTVVPGVQGGYVARRCLAGQPIDYRGFADQGHLSIVLEDSPAPGHLVEWTRERFAGRPGPAACRIARDAPTT